MVRFPGDVSVGCGGDFESILGGAQGGAVHQ